MGRPASAASHDIRRSSARAAFNACSGWKVTMALTRGFTRSICAMKACITSVADTLRARRSRARARAHQHDVELLLRVARLDLHRDALADEAGEHFQRGCFFFQEAVDHALRG